jgi:hypothetical protein
MEESPDLLSDHLDESDSKVIFDSLLFLTSAEQSEEEEDVEEGSRVETHVKNQATKVIEERNER